MQEQYNPSKIESAMQKRWQEQDVFTAKETVRRRQVLLPVHVPLP